MALPYTIRNSDNTLIITIPEGVVDESSLSLSLVGRNVSNYGPYFARNVLRQLENFASATSPNYPITGQLWYDKANEVLKVYTGSAWSKMLELEGLNLGDLSTAVEDSVLKYNGSNWVPGTGGVGYTGSGGVGTTGFTGSAGTQGTMGYTGSGYTGSQGSVGYTGSAGGGGGGDGYTGSQGSVGYTGSAGGGGGDGYTGSFGYTGSIGYTGSALTVPGSAGQILYNNAGTLGALASFSFNSIVNPDVLSLSGDFVLAKDTDITQGEIKFGNGTKSLFCDGNAFTLNAGLTVGGALFVNKLTDPAEGGEIRLQTASGSTLSGGNVVLDMNTDTIRFFESGGNVRGLKCNLTTTAAGQSEIIHADNFSSYLGSNGITAELIPHAVARIADNAALSASYGITSASVLADVFTITLSDAVSSTTNMVCVVTPQYPSATPGYSAAYRPLSNTTVEVTVVENGTNPSPDARSFSIVIYDITT